MRELRHRLAEAVSDFRPREDEGLTETRRRARRRQLRRRIGAGIAGLVLTAVAAALTWAGIPSRPIVRPLVGPTPTPSALPKEFAPETGTTFCSYWREHRFCLTRTSPVITVSEGVRTGHHWSLRAYAARYTGPLRFDASSRSEGSVMMMCSGWAWTGPRTWFCQSTVPEDAMFGIELGRGMEESSEPRSGPLISDETRPLEGLEKGGGGFVGDATGPQRASFVWTPDETARVEVAVDDAPSSDALLVGPFGELNPNLKIAVAFFPLDARNVLYTAYDESGAVLWREHNRFP